MAIYTLFQISKLPGESWGSILRQVRATQGGRGWLAGKSEHVQAD